MGDRHLFFGKTAEGSTGRLLQLCAAYFFFYVVTGVTVKYFTGKPELGFPGMLEMEFLAYSTLGGAGICLAVVLARGWYLSKSARLIRVAGMRIPSEYLYILPSGVCTAVVIPTTTLMYTLPISVMVAMVIMRSSVIVISRVVDAVQCAQGILHKKVYKEENLAVVFALAAAGVKLLWVRAGDFDFLGSGAAVTILGSYILAYSLRIYIMNYYKNTRPKGMEQDNKWFFAIEQIMASVAMAAAAGVILWAPSAFGWNPPQVQIFNGAISDPAPLWGWAVLAGTAYGMVAFFSVFIFMFKGRTATFAGLVNRLTSLVAGTAATLSSYLLLGGRFPKAEDWVSLALILIAVGFLTVAEQRRVKELVAAHEIPKEPQGSFRVPARA